MCIHSDSAVILSFRHCRAHSFYSFLRIFPPQPVVEHSDKCFCAKKSDNDKECPVCLDNFNIGDMVTWSIAGECEHVFHLECIKEWLLRHTECPCCRRLFMPVDHNTKNLTQDMLKVMAMTRLERYQATHYCVEDGLVCADAKSSFVALSATMNSDISDNVSDSDSIRVSPIDVDEEDSVKNSTDEQLHSIDTTCTQLVEHGNAESEVIVSACDLSTEPKFDEEMGVATLASGVEKEEE